MKEFDELRRELAPVFQDYGVRRALVFGSFVKGGATEKSDVDLYVDSGLRGMKFVGLIESVRERLGGRDVDMIDVTHVERGSRVEDEIKQTGVVIYEGCTYNREDAGAGGEDSRVYGRCNV